MNSQVFDHTSLIPFIGAVFDPQGSRRLAEANITPWRAAVCGDLTSAFNFKTPNAAIVAMPSTTAYVPPNGHRQTPGYAPVPPVRQSVPKQEPGVRPARALPYRLYTVAALDAENGDATITFTNPGKQAAVFLVRSANFLDGQRSYTVEPGKTLTGIWATNSLPYDLSVRGPNGFFRRFTGCFLDGAAGPTVQENDAGLKPAIRLALTNGTADDVQLVITNAYSGDEVPVFLAAGQTATRDFALNARHGWYDMLVTMAAKPGFGIHLAGHVETGADSFTDSMIG